MTNQVTNQVTARLRRRRSPQMFADLVPDSRVDFHAVSAMRPMLTVTFDRDLTPEEAKAVADRISSIDDEDLADRTALVELAAAVEAMEPTPVRQLLLRLTTRALDT